MQDTLPRKNLWGIIKERKFIRKITRKIKNIYESNNNRIITQSRPSQAFSTNDELRKIERWVKISIYILIKDIYKK